MAVIPIQEIHVSDTGLDYRITVMDAEGPVDFSEANVIRVHFQKPDGSFVAINAVLQEGSDGTDGKIEFTTTPTTFDQAGLWRWQVYSEIGPDLKYSNIAKFRVYPNLPLEV